MKDLLEGCIVAFSMYSRLPVPRRAWSDGNMKYALCFFPLIGVVIGLLQWGWFLLAGVLSAGPLLRAAGLTVLPLFVTGGIHMDGLLDTADALSSGKSREEMLQILHDSRSGAFAVITCGVYLTLSLGAYAELGAAAMPRLVLVHGMSRCLSGYAALRFPKARTDGLLHTFSEKAMNHRASDVLTGLLLAAIIVLTATGPLCGIVVTALAMGTFFLYRRLCEKRFGGTTGDLAGAFLETAELAMLLGLVFTMR